jgi:type VI secretion system protein ImpJ
MFLRPHHLQHYDLYLESREIGYLHALENYGWGLIRLEIQEDALDNHLLSVKALRAVLHDGTLIEVPGNARLPSRQIDKKVVEVGRTLDVSVGIHNVDERRPHAAPEGETPGLARYAPVTEEIYDLETGRDPIPVERLEYDLRVFLGDEPAHGYETIPITRLAMTGDPARPIGFAAGFAPPCLAISASKVLHGAARAVVERLATVLRDMGEVRGSDKASELILFQALSGSMPVLRDMVQDGMVHPRRVYHEMTRLAGTLYFRDETGRSFDEIPAYDHREPGPAFEGLRDLIHQLSRPVFERRYRRVPMVRVQDQYRVDVPAESKKPGARLYLEVLADDSAPQLRTIIMKAKISNQGRIDHLIRFALPGIATEAQPGPPPEMPPGQTGSFFRLKIEEGVEWPSQVVPAGDVAALLMGAPQDIKLNLIVILPGT